MPHYRLHCFPESGNAYKLALMLALCGLPYETVWVDFLGGETRSAEWRAAVNEMGEVPVLESDGERLTQTGAVLTLLAQRHGRFGGASEAERFEVLRWLLWDNHKLTAYVAVHRWLISFTADPKPDVVAFMRGRAEGALAIAEKHFDTNAFAVGDAPTIADISMSAYLSYPKEELGFDLAATHPAVTAWLKRIAALPGWKAPYDLIPGPRFSRKV